MIIEYLRNTLWIAIGGALGASLRYSVYFVFYMLHINGFWATLMVNIVGSFIVGLLSSWLPALNPKLNYLFMVGCLGAFTTFSTFSADFIRLIEGKEWLTALFYLVLSVMGGFLAFIFGNYISSKF